MSIWAVDGNVLMGFGGYALGNPSMADLWQTSDLGSSWVQVSYTNSPAGAREGAFTTVVGQNLLRCGGANTDSTVTYNDCHYLPIATGSLALSFNNDGGPLTVYPPFRQSITVPYTLGAVNGRLTMTATFSVQSVTYSLNDQPPPSGGLTSGVAKTIDVVAGCTNQLTVYALSSVYQFSIGAGPLCHTSIPADAA